MKRMLQVFLLLSAVALAFSVSIEALEAQRSFRGGTSTSRGSSGSTSRSTSRSASPSSTRSFRGSSTRRSTPSRSTSRSTPSRTSRTPTRSATPSRSFRGGTATRPNATRSSTPSRSSSSSRSRTNYTPSRSFRSGSRSSSTRSTNRGFRTPQAPSSRYSSRSSSSRLGSGFRSSSKSSASSSSPSTSRSFRATGSSPFRTFKSSAQSTNFRASSTTQRTQNHSAPSRASYGTSGTRAYLYSYHYNSYPYSYAYYQPATAFYSTAPSAWGWGTYSGLRQYHYYDSYSYVGIDLSTHHYHLGRDLSRVSYYKPYTYYYRGRRCSYLTNYGFHRLSLAGRHYRFCRPVYYSYSTYYDWDYDGYDYSYISRQSLQRERDEAYQEGEDAGFEDGYREGYYDGAMSEQAYGGVDRRATITRSPRVQKTSIFTTEWSDHANDAREKYAEGDYSGAIKDFQSAAIANPNSATLKRDLGQSAFALGRYELAAFSMRRAIELNSDILADSSSPRAQMEALEIYDQQLARLEAEIEGKKRDDGLYFIFGVQSYLTGDYQKAANAFANVVALNGKDKLAAKLAKASAELAKE